MKTAIKILIAEHDLIDLELIHHELRKTGIVFVSEVVNNEQEYIDQLEKCKPDIILSDYTFPSFDGLTAFKIREIQAPDIPFIFISGTIGEEKSIELIRSGVTDYVLKDTMVSLGHKVLRALKESRANQLKKQIELALIKSEGRLARAEQLAHMGNWEWTFATNDLTWSEEIYRIYALQPDQTVPLYELSLSFIHIEDADAVLKKMNDSRRSGLDFSMTYRIVCKNGLTKQIYMDSKLMYAMEGEATGCYGIIQDVTHTVLLERKLSNERSSRLKNITNAVLTAQENERAEIGKELHDNLNQILGATKLYVDLAKTDDEQRDFCLDKASNYIMTVINHIRAISKKMIIPSERFVGLFGCINMLKYDLSIIHPVDIQFYVDNIEEQDMEEKLQLNIYRIIQEQLNNIVKHSKATHATIDLSRQEDEIILLISDDGMGYDTSKRRQGVGIRNIMSRAELYQGTAEVTSTPGQGYDLKIRLPLYSHINNDGKLSEIATN